MSFAPQRAVPAALSLAVMFALCAAGLLDEAFATGDPFVGTWAMNLQRSRYESGDLPRQMLIVMSPAERGIHYRSQTTLSNGNRVSSEYTAEYDSGLAMVVGNAGILAPVSLRRLDERTVECSYMSGMRVVATSRRVVSDDGTTLTVSTVSKARDGTTGTNLAVFDRVN